MFDLDDERAIAEADPGNAREHIGELPQQCADAWRQAQQLSLPESYRSPQSVAIVGMGGSAIGGALLARLVADECQVPIHSVGGYDLPAHVGPDTLVAVSSYSGNTEETLCASSQAMDRGCKLVAVTTDGKLAERAAEKGIPILRFTYEAAPRAALGYSLTLLLALMCRVGLVRDYGSDLDEAVEILQAWQPELAPGVPLERNAAKRLAEQILRRLPVVYGAGFLAPVARRWKGQFNENSKNWAFWEELPELNHNSVVGYGLPDAIRKRVAVLFLRSSWDHPRIKVRWEATRGLLLREGVMVDAAWGRGESRLAHMLSLIHFGDYVSFYLALLNGVDPSPVAPIDYLKKELAQESSGECGER